LKVHPSQPRDWVKEFSDDPQQAFLGHGQMKPEQLEIAQLKREVAKRKVEPSSGCGRKVREPAFAGMLLRDSLY
jgi:transposase-like protein